MHGRARWPSLLAAGAYLWGTASTSAASAASALTTVAQTAAAPELITRPKLIAAPKVIAKPDPCPAALASSPLEPPAAAAGQGPDPLTAPYSPPVQPPTNDYRHRIATTPWGPPILPSWCVWIEPAAQNPGAEAGRWSLAVEAALASWGELVQLNRVEDPQRAQVLLLRRRPPRREDGSGRLRASNGRSELALVLVRRHQQQLLEPRVIVQVNPEQRQQVVQAAALHELGHAFGLWGHSDQAGDAMAASPANPPVLALSSRDRATWRWLRQLPSQFGQPWDAAPKPVPSKPAPGEPLR